MRTGISGLEGVKQAKSKLNSFLRQTQSIQESELGTMVAELLPEMQRQAPYKTGKLESGVYCRRSTRLGIIAGAKAMHKGYNYAVKQHEDTSLEHPIKGNAKFIEGPLEEAVTRFIRRTRERVNDAW